MSLKEDLLREVRLVFSSPWEETLGRVVPDPPVVGLGNKATLLNQAVVLYADLDGSTNMVDSNYWQFSAEIYKTFLHCAAKIIKSENGVITAYDGDRIMAVFIGDSKCDRAVKVALHLQFAVTEIIQPAINQQYNTDFVIGHTVGIDMSDIRAVRTGVRGDNDLVWVGKAANYAAKLTNLPRHYPTRITEEVYFNMTEYSRLSGQKICGRKQTGLQ